MDLSSSSNLFPFDALHNQVLGADSEFDVPAADLVPPSPILTPSQVEFSWSCGSIPVLLYDEAYTSGDSDAESVSKRGSRSGCPFGEASPSAEDLEPANYGESDSGSGCDYAFGAEAEPAAADSGTGFGPSTPQRASAPKRISASGGPIPSIVSESSPGPESDVYPSRISMRTASGGSHLSNGLEVSRWSADSDSVFLSERTSKISESVSTHRSNSINPSIMINSGLSSGSLNVERLAEDNGEDESAFQTPTKAPLRPAVSWISSRSWDYDKYEAYVAREEPSRHALISNSLEPYVEFQTGAHPDVTPPNKRTALGNRDINVLNIDTPRACRVGAATAVPVATGLDRGRDHHPHNVAKEGSRTRTGSPRRHSPHPAARVRAPETFDDSRLADVCVQFLIDQEGFRAAEPRFRYTGTARIRVGHAHGSRSVSGAPSSSVEVVQMAQFRMAKRESYHFHYAPFETPPILRRVTVNSDETHDYVSKQALLTLKANGVYVLHGQEALVPGHGYGRGYSEEATKLHWKLEYLVDDRVIDASRRIMDGEKVLTLLSFSCSPALLFPSQAKRNTLMHVFKKSVAPKLVAEKVQPPGMGVSVGGVGGTSGHDTKNGHGDAIHAAASNNSKGAVVSQDHAHPPQIIPSSQTHTHISHPRAKMYGWGGFHRRGQSHSVRRGTMYGDLAHKAVAQRQTGIGHRTSPSHGHLQYDVGGNYGSQHEKIIHTDSKRRRNSFAEEWRFLGEPVVVNAPFKMFSSSRHHWEAAEPPPLDSADVSPTRYILPPEQLTKLLDSIAVSDGGKQAKSEKEYRGKNPNSKLPTGSPSSTVTGKTSGTIIDARTSLGSAPLPVPLRHHHVGSDPKDLRPIR